MQSKEFVQHLETRLAQHAENALGGDCLNFGEEGVIFGLVAYVTGRRMCFDLFSGNTLDADDKDIGIVLNSQRCYYQNPRQIIFNDRGLAGAQEAQNLHTVPGLRQELIFELQDIIIERFAVSETMPPTIDLAAELRNLEE